MIKKYFIVVLISLIIFISACTQETVQQPVNSVQSAQSEKIEKEVMPKEKANPSLSIISPQDGNLIRNSKIIVELKAENFKIVPVGSPIAEGEGHFHVWLDSEKKVTTDKTVVFEKVVSGKHSIVAELVKSGHSSLSPKVTRAITINAESDYVPEPEIKKEGVREYTIEADDKDFYPNRISAKINETVRINFKFRDDAIYFAGMDVRGPFDDARYKLKGSQPITREFVMKGETKIDSYWPSSGVHKATLIVEVEK